MHTNTLDEAVEAFRALPNSPNAENLLAVAVQYCDDGMIAESTRDEYVSEALAVLG